MDKTDLMRALTALGSIPIERVEEICVAERDGRCVVLPCKVGDTLYHVGLISCRDCPKRGPLTLCKDFRDMYGEPMTLEDCEEDCIETVREYPAKFDLDLIRLLGHTVFLTRAEAEAALEKKGE